ncbi:hypothetical protein, partial [Pseudomonas sp. C11]|uniref:hypothetical protein n=1 Tax=Pseudomonas sp. C11 TaxID=3075550 RepID=UPI002AFEA349
HAERNADQYLAAGMLLDQAHNLDLDDRLAQAKGCEDRTATAANRPAHDCALVWLDDRVDIAIVNLEACEVGTADFPAQELLIAY